MNLRTWCFLTLNAGPLSAGVLCCLLAVAACSREEKGDVANVSAEDTLVMQVGGSLSRRPAAPLRIEGACPFECCTYGAWTTTDPTTIYERPDENAVLLTVPADTRQEAATGYVLLTRIGVAVARDTVRMYGESGDPYLAEVGDTLFVLDNVGEGFRRVWYEGGIYQSDAASGIDTGIASPVEVLREPEQQWWARVQTVDGRAGWLWMDRTPQMEGADACS